mgnify:CR=1 FL=1
MAETATNTNTNTNTNTDKIQIAVYYNKLNEDAIKPYLIMFLKNKPIACIEYEPPPQGIIPPTRMQRFAKIFSFRKSQAQISDEEPTITKLDNFKTIYELLSDLIINDPSFDVDINNNYVITNINTKLDENNIVNILYNYIKGDNKSIINIKKIKDFTDNINEFIKKGELLDKNIIDELLKPNPSVSSANQTQPPVKTHENGTSVNVDIDGNIRKGTIISHNSNDNTYKIKYDDDNTEAIVPYNSISINMGGNLRNNKKNKKTLKRKKRNIRKTKNIIY